MRTSGRNDQEPMAEMNVTPLVDVMLVLLVIFIVTAPLIVPRAIQINLPKAGASKAQPEQSPHVLLVPADGSLQYKNQPVSDTELASQLRSGIATGPLQLQIHADESVPYGRIAQVMSLAQSSGVTQLSFVTVNASKRP